MGRLVMKFGGTSVANIERIRNVARHVKREVDAGNDVAVVVSAMAGKTNELVDWCREASPMHDAREYDAVVASGEQVTAGLLAIMLQGLGIQARSWQGWQIPIRTSDAHASARILDIDGTEIINRFKDRQETPYKQYKITQEDWRNRNKWEAYEAAACETRDLDERAPRQREC